MALSRRAFVSSLASASLLAACAGRRAGGGATRVVFKHGKLFGDPRVLRELLDEFERAHPGLAVVDQSPPGATSG